MRLFLFLFASGEGDVVVADVGGGRDGGGGVGGIGGGGSLLSPADTLCLSTVSIVVRPQQRHQRRQQNLSAGEFAVALGAGRLLDRLTTCRPEM